MKLIEALRIVGAPAPDSAMPLKLLLATGFSPLHLQTFLAAHLRTAFPLHNVTIQTGLYADLACTLERAREAAFDAVIGVIEWPDLDPRLGLRNLGGWRPTDLPDILSRVGVGARRIEDAVQSVSKRMLVTICLPTLPLPPLSFNAGWQASNFELEVRECVSALASRLSRSERIRIVNPQRLDLLSPPDSRFNVKSELLYGFPYELSHAAILAQQLVLLVQCRSPKKGLITDLDDTLWSGSVGEIDPSGVSWDLDHRSQMHGVYQQLLRALAESGVLIAVASKNNLANAIEAFRREDVLLPEKCVFPMEIHWGPKSESVRRILNTWNISADSVVFVDDSPMELAEVGDAFPDMECIHFPCGNDRSIYDLLEKLRDLFGKPRISEEDPIRLQSIRCAQGVREEMLAMERSSECFLEQINGAVTLDFSKDPPDPRALELLNKTNQFHLNGKRYTEGEWLNYLRRPETFLWTVSYQDRFGPLGRIAAITGRITGDMLFVDNWAMSCRAFARQIEHQCLGHLFERYEMEGIVLHFAPTNRNGPIRDFFLSILGEEPRGTFLLSRTGFLAVRPQPLHRIEDSHANAARLSDLSGAL